ncbi:hypothetical protein N5079_14815 [Planotetraspora sp. A-T 1434]|uniref:hypothetical protein n=1 Tax=Planotetraspora sp. A-T 1434 TaxID=2979219 RepID=UPI0021BE5876|nr:hypothetical protein [Planotetraspora sp. A-T 1434]MCT9931490.1 hypothetical protein [Planotetraspora sp. A-T 1434]
MTHTPTDFDDNPAPATTQSARWSWLAGWPGWIGWAATAWSLAYAILGLFWWGGGAGFPFGIAHDPAGKGVSLLEHAQPETTGPVLAVAGLCGAAVSAVLSRTRRRGLIGGALAGAGWATAVALAVVIPDYRPLLAVVRAPMLLVGAPLGWTEIRWSDFFGFFLPWPVLNQILFIAGGLFWAGTVLAYRRRVRAACGNCGRGDTVAVWTTAIAAARWGRWAVAVAVAVPIGYALTRWAWALDIPLGASRAGLHKEAAESPGIWLAGAMIATMGAGGALLTIGLVRPWGEVYPCWIPYLRGKRVRPRTAIIPATAVALLVTSAGLMTLRWLVDGRIALKADNWGFFVPEFFWPVWGGALGMATLAYHLRRRGRCAYCGRGATPIQIVHRKTGAGSDTRARSIPPAPRWAVRVAWVVPVCVLPSAVWRAATAFDDDISLANEGWYLLLLSALSMGLALLTLGLVYPWGERVPRWVPVLGGRDVPARVAVIVAATGAMLLIGLCLYALLNSVLHFVPRGPVLIGAGEAERPRPGWPVLILYAPLLLWGPLLLTVTVNYWRRNPRAHAHGRATARRRWPQR